jgi:hypothetical protein
MPDLSRLARECYERKPKNSQRPMTPALKCCVLARLQRLLHGIQKLVRVERLAQRRGYTEQHCGG